MDKVNLVVRRDIESDGTLRIDVYVVLDKGLEYIGFAYMRNHSCSANALAVDMYLSKYGGTRTIGDFIVNRV